MLQVQLPEGKQATAGVEREDKRRKDGGKVEERRMDQETMQE